MKHSESIKSIAPALLSAQKMIGGAKKGSTNPFFHSSYADLGAVMEACKDALNENGITVLQPVGNGVLETVLLHTSGEWISEEMNIATKSENNPQDQGSAITYARRYSLQSMVFIPAEDDDGEKAMDRTPRPQATQSYDEGMTFSQWSAIGDYISRMVQFGVPQAVIYKKFNLTEPITQKSLTKAQASKLIGLSADLVAGKITLDEAKKFFYEA